MSLAELGGLLASLGMLAASGLISAAYLMQGLASSAISRAIRAPLAERRPLDRIYTITWVLAAAVGAWISRQSSVFTILAVALAFKSGADLGSRVIYSVHDLSLLGQAKGLRSAVSRALALASLPSLFFLLSWWLFQQAASLAVRVFLGLRLDLVALALWLLGVAFGLAFGAARSRGEPGILLKGELALVLGSKAREFLSPG